MKKRLAAFLMTLTVFVCAGCGVFTPPANQQPIPPGPGKDPSESGEGDPFTVNLTVNGAPYYPLVPISAQWRGADGDAFQAQFNEMGVAECVGPDGEYQVTLDSVPTGYTYDCNGYTADNDRRETTIELLPILRPRSGTGTGMWSCYRITQLGTYRAVIDSPEDGVWYEYTPVAADAGELSLQSWVDISANEINPKVELYNGTFAAKYFDSLQDGGGASSTYTKNFKVIYRVNKDEIGNCFTFRVFAETNGSYPVTVDFTIKREGDYVRPDAQYEPVYATGPFADSSAPTSGTWRYAYDDTGRVLLTEYDDGSPRYALNPEDQFYHLVNPDGSFGPILYARLTQDNEVMDTVEDGQSGSGMGFMFPLVVLHFSGKNYDPFMGKNDYAESPTGYSTHCNAQGAHPLTEELRIFLQEYALSQELFKDGFGMAEIAGLNSSENNMWLFSCGYYQ